MQGEYANGVTKRRMPAYYSNSTGIMCKAYFGLGVARTKKQDGNSRQD